MLFVEGEQTFATSLFNFVFDLAFHTCSSRALSWREAKDMGFGEVELLSKLIGLLKILVGLAWEAGDDIGTDGNVRNDLFGSGNECTIASTIVAACHATEE